MSAAPSTAEIPPDRRLPRLVVTLGIVSLLTDVHSEMIHSILPVFVAETLGSGALGVGLMEGIADAVAAGVRIVSGRMSDRSGRRKPLTFFGYALSTCSKLLWAAAHGTFAALAIRSTDRVGKGFREAPRDAMVADVVPPERRGAAYGLHRTFDTTGAVLGSGIAFLLLARGAADRSLMLWAAIPGLLALAVLVFAVREPAKKRAVAVGVAPPPSPAGPDGTVRLGRFFAIEGFFELAHCSYAFFLLRARDAGVPVATIPLLYLGFNVVYATVPYPLGRLADRVGRMPVLAAGFLLFGAAAACASLARGLDAPLIASFALFGLAEAIVVATPRAIVAEALGRARRGTALGFHYGIVGAGAVGSGLLFGFLWTVAGPSAVFGGAAVAAVFAAALLPLARSRRPV